MAKPVGPSELKLASPLSLLNEEERHGDRQAEEVLLLSFTSDLGFFESFGLGAAQATGARVTVVDDVRMSDPDPRAARRAGRSYLAGHAICGGAFHPKLLVIAGPERAIAAIGSGNVTLAGWQANAELWSVLRAGPQGCPTALIDLADWLRGLPERVHFSLGVPDALSRVARLLDGLALHGTAGDVRVVSNNDRSILDQLPIGPVDDLAVCAPFHDRGAVALRALVARMRPGQLRVAYQPGLTQLDGPAVAAVAAEADAELRIDCEQRYRHGKLIEWSVEGHRYALTGSPNLSGAALLRRLEDNGNCELGTIAPVMTSLLPEGGPSTTATLSEQRIVVRTRPSGGPLILGATKIESGLHVLFTSALPSAGHLELSPAVSPPESWERIGDVAAGSTEAMLATVAEGGSRIRFAVRKTDGEMQHSNLVFVVDPFRIGRRPGVAATQSPETTPDDLFSNPRLAERFFGDLTALRSGLSDSVPSSMPALFARTDPSPADHDWESYLDICAGRIGHPLLRFALGLPTQPAQGDDTFTALLPVSWTDESVLDNAVGLDDDDADEVASEQEDDWVSAVAKLPDLSAEKESVRRRYRRWAGQLADAVEWLPAPERMLAVRLVLWTSAVGVWDHNDRSWISLLSTALRSLGDSDYPPESEANVGSLAAVALSVLRTEVPRYAHTESSIAFDRAAEAVAHLLVASEPAIVAEYTSLLQNAFGAAVSAETIDAVVSDVVQDDPIKDAMWALAERNRDAHRHGGRLLHIVGTFTNPLPAALEAVGAAEEADLVGAWASGSDGRWVLCIWQPPDLFTIDGSEPRVRWRHFKLSGLLTPRGLALRRSTASAPAVSHGPHVRPFPEALAALERLGLESPNPPPCAYLP